MKLSLLETGLNDAKRKKVRKGDIQRLIGKHIFAYASKEGSRGDQSAGFETSRIEEMQEFRRTHRNLRLEHAEEEVSPPSSPSAAGRHLPSTLDLPGQESRVVEVGPGAANRHGQGDRAACPGDAYPRRARKAPTY